MKKDDARNQNLEAAFCEPETLTVGTLCLRPFSLGTLNLCRQLGLTMFLDDSAELTDADKQRQIAAFAWAQSAPLREVISAVRKGTWQEAVDEFEFGLAVSDLPALLAEIQRIGELAGAASVEVAPKPGSSDDGAPGN